MTELETQERRHANSLVLKTDCPHCDKIFAEVTRFSLPQKDGTTRTFIKGKCGHTIVQHGAKRVDYSQHSSLDNRKPYPYQVEGMQFAEDSGFKTGLFDDMGLGKTIQALCPIVYHEELRPCAIFCKAGLITQWSLEVIRWCNSDMEKITILPQVIFSGKDEIIGLPVTIFSLDVLRNFSIEDFEAAGFQYIIIDECQHIKNPESQRTHQVRRMCKNVPHVEGLSGTPIKNRPSEYFTILNLLNPERFPSMWSFQSKYLEMYYTGYGNKERGLRNPKRFKKDTEDFIIRRLRNDVMPELPKVDRKMFYVDLEKRAAREYEKESRAFNAYYEKLEREGEENSQEATTNLLARLARLRHICGRSKSIDCYEFVTEFMMTTDRKLTVFVHHQDVGGSLMANLTAWCKKMSFDPPLSIIGGMDSEKRQDVIDRFKEPGKNRILIASTLASGEGLTLQYQCCDCIILERQWNPANEEQVEARFTRPDSVNMGGYVSSTYMLAGGTIDEWLTELVEKKRAMFQQVMDSKETRWQDSSLQADLISIVVQKNREKWAL